MAKSAIIGMIFKRGVQRYECVAIRPHQRIDGRMTKLAVWITTCPECGEAFEVVCTTSMNRGPGNRRCPLHHNPGQRVEQSARAARRKKCVSNSNPADTSSRLPRAGDGQNAAAKAAQADDRGLQ
jgi:hypothetical protein